MKISELTQTEVIDEQVNFLLKGTEKPDLERLKNQWDVSKHRVMQDSEYLKDKEIKDADGNLVGMKKVNRIAAPFQKMIVNTSVAFAFANEVEIADNADGDSGREAVLTAIYRILYDNKDSSFNRKMARELYRSTEVAEYWYYEKTEPHDDYGFTCSFRIKVKLITPWNGDKLLPHFDSYDNMKAFARNYSVTDSEGNKIEYLDVFTSDEIRRLKKSDNAWTEDYYTDSNGNVVSVSQGNILGKIPIVYGSQDTAEWQDVQTDIDRLELLFSRHAEINDYHAAPKTFVEGELISAPQAGEANSILVGTQGSKASILSWNDSPESIRLEIETRLENIYKFTRTPDVSFKSVKAINQISGVMLKMLFMDAHLKVMEKEEIWDEYFTRRFNILKAYVGKLLNPSLAQAASQLELTPSFKPYMIDDTKEWINTLLSANGNKPLISQQKAAELAGLTANPDSDWLLIKSEESEQNYSEVFQPTNL
ncbi:Phage portal protein, SPP1 Gp6-like [Cruoricaptor ignavus]|uniref:Phage portal protein, SPP1 Gp6-like n=1 Tax=Cruoricaptor ignavus TaxID=1118202 RepID=A0A1M6G6M7_9FLAO|nr:phage portal protein [Cruoricaptor ignavus]SHJ05636.1 Phage portal protein, SPP1 Gp6-like [Cruoricaptor ignavus]